MSAQPTATKTPAATKTAKRAAKPSATVESITAALSGQGGCTPKMAARVARAYVDGVAPTKYTDAVQNADPLAAMLYGCGPTSEGKRRGDAVLTILATFAKPRAKR